MNLTSQIIDAIGKSPIAFSKVVNGNNVNGWISREMWVLPDAIKRVEKKWPSLNRGNIALLCGASSELPETLAAFAPGLSKFPLIAIPDVDVRSIVALFRTGAYAEENNNLPPIFDSIRLKLGFVNL